MPLALVRTPRFSIEWGAPAMKRATSQTVATTSIDRSGRLVISKDIRRRAGLRPGVQLKILYRAGRVEIEPAPTPVRLARRGPVTVAEEPLQPLASGTSSGRGRRAMRPAGGALTWQLLRSTPVCCLRRSSPGTTMTSEPALPFDHALPEGCA